MEVVEMIAKPTVPVVPEVVVMGEAKERVVVIVMVIVMVMVMVAVMRELVAV